MMNSRIVLNVDTDVGAAYLKLTDEPIVETVEVTPDVQVDVDATGTVVGIELLDLSAEIPTEILNRTFQFAAPDHVVILSRLRPSIGALVTYGSYASTGQAYVPALSLQPA